MFEDNDRNFEEKDREEIVHRYEDMLRKKKPLFFDIDDFESIIDFYLDQNKFTNAFEATRIASGLFPTSPGIMVRKAQMLIDKGKPVEAMNELKKAALLDSDNFEIYLLQGVASLHIGNVKESIKYFDECIAHVYDGIRKDDILFSIGFHLGHANKFSIAIKYLYQCLEYNSENADALAEIAFCYDGNAEYEKSIEYYLKCLDVDPFSENCWYNLGLVYSKTTKNEKAVEAFDFALAIDPAYLSAHLAKANIYLIQENYRESVKIYEEYLEYDTEYNEVYYYIGECYEKLEKLDDALKYYELVIKNNENHVEAWLGMGIIKMYLDDYPKSMVYLNKAVGLDPENPEARYSLAELYLKTGVYEDGLTHIEEAIKVVPSEVDYLLLQSELYFALKDFNKSVSVLENSYHLLEEKAPVFYRLAGLGVTELPSEKAVDYLKRAIDTDPALIYDFLRIFPEAKNFEGFKGLLNLPDQKNTK